MASQRPERHVGPIVSTKYWHRLDDGRLQCDLCPRACHLHEGQRGLCLVRASYHGAVVLTTYGRTSGFCIDPVEKKPLYHFLPGTPVLSFGTVGCNLLCRHCQNWDISHVRDTAPLADGGSPERIAEVAAKRGCKSVAFTYNDPVIYHEFAIDVARACQARGIRTIAVTAGYVNPLPRAEFFRHMDAVNVDLKAFTDRFYGNICGGHLDPVLQTLDYIRHQTTAWLEITNLLIPGENDGDAEIGALTEWVARRLGPDVPLHFSAFHPDWKMQDHPATPLETLRRARRIGLRNGLRYVYTGNLPDDEGNSTWCHQCGTRLVRRQAYEISAWHLTKDGKCWTCGTPCAGVFPELPGQWGSRREPVRIGEAPPRGAIVSLRS